MFAQINSCIGRWQVENVYSKSICSSINCYVFHSLWHESVHGENDLPIIYLRAYLIMILAAAVLANHSPRKSKEVSTWNHPGWLESVHSKTLHLLIISIDDAIKDTCIWPLAWHNMYNSCQSLLLCTNVPNDNSIPFIYRSSQLTLICVCCTHFYMWSTLSCYLIQLFWTTVIVKVTG